LVTDSHQEIAITYAHLPAGYIVGKLLSEKFESRIKSYYVFWFWGLFGSIAPDLDYLYLKLFDARKYDHHYYLTHIPLIWGMLLAGSILWLIASKKSQIPVLAFMFSLNGFFHLILDSVPHRIFWMAPLSYKGYSLASLISRIDPAMIDEHPFWNKSVEAIIFIVAWYLFIYNGNSGRNSSKNTSTNSSDPNQQEHLGR
jgi:hypothetical protein